VLVGLLEAAVFGLVAASVLSGEFMPKRRKPILLSGNRHGCRGEAWSSSNPPPCCDAREPPET
jgi:hypothetical protein